MNKQNRVNKSDSHRILLSETIPSEVPIIFSNDGFYRNCLLSQKNNYYPKDLFDYIVIGEQENKSTIPLSYKIKKDSYSLRTLSLMHPYSQWRFIGFYREYSGVICFHCSKSKASLRSPQKIGSSFYVKNKNENIKRYKLDSIDTEEEDKTIKHPSSYFAYRGVNRLHKFFDSSDYLKFEKKYSSMWMIDISKCFDSIYTHTIAWAVKSKSFAKKNIDIKSSFGQVFDTLMQRCNDNETNGIIIGPEISRVFAEIICQDVDIKTIASLSNKHNIKFGKEYTFRRYVDDTFIFSIDEATSVLVVEELTDQFSKYNLHINERKIKTFYRPFYTEQSRIIRTISLEVNDFFKKFTKIATVDDKKIILPESILRVDKLVNSFINTIKSICTEGNYGYSLVSGYIISSLSNRILKLVDIDLKKIENKEELDAKYKNCFITILQTLYFFYSVQPSVNSSYSLGKSIILSCRFFEKEFPQYEPTIKQKIFELTIDLLKQNQFSQKTHRENLIPLEKINIILSISEMGGDYLLSSGFMKKLFDFTSSSFSYFEIMSCLFYIKDNQDYRELRDGLEIQIKLKLTDLSDIQRNSEVVYIFLDSLSCPYLDVAFKKELLTKFYKDNNKTIPEAKALEQMLNYMGNNEWFINWKTIDLLNMLEKKELKTVY